MAVVKILIAGAEGSGKRELVKSISDVITVPSPMGASRSGRANRARTHHAIEFGQIDIDASLAVQLYVLPADRQSDFMWQILGQDAAGFVVLASAEGIADLDETRHMLSVLARTGIPFVVGVNGSDVGEEAIIRRVRQGLQVGPEVAVRPCDCTERASVKALLCDLFRSIGATLARRADQPAGTGG